MTIPAKEIGSHLDKFLKNSSLVYQGVRFDLRRSEFLTKNGQLKAYEALIHPGAAVILPLMDQDSIVMIRNKRIAIGETIWELPAGTLEHKEEPAASALRELAEETGYQAESIQLLTTFYSSPGISNEVMHAFVAKDLHFVGQKLDAGEVITPEILPWTQVMKMIHSGEIRDAKTILTLLFYRVYQSDK
ncbi:MAG: NUDIX hydrolase [Parachlamydiaceae bacterium]|nr:NUDIX hydrolase [Parachlamydiaceae bacterium]